MILAAGLSPAWQQVLRFDGFATGRVNRASQAFWYGSGKVLNAAAAVARLGGPVQVLSPLGGLAAAPIAAEFAAAGIPARWISTHLPTRICTTILDESSGVTTELVENAAPLSPAELAEFQREYAATAAQAQSVILTGSIPAGTPETFFADLLDVTGCPAILDIRGPELWPALERRPLVIKPNREELAHTLGRPLADAAALQAALGELQDRGARWIVVSDGPGPVWVAGPEGQYRLWPAPLPRVVNPIGSGDCLAAGLAWALRDGRPMLAAIRYGLGCAAANVGELLAARIVRDAAEAFAAAVRVEFVV